MVKEIAYDLSDYQTVKELRREDLKTVNALETKNAFQDDIISEQKFQISELYKIIDLKDPDPWYVKLWGVLRWVSIGVLIGVGISL